jgi:CHRD domain
MKRVTFMLAAVAGGLLLIGSLTATAAPPTPKKTTICHWTGKKYVKTSVGARALKGHMHHGRDVMPAPATCPSQPLSPARAGGRPLTATLTGAAEVPGPGDPDGSGTATFRLNPGQGRVCFVVTAAKIVLPATAAHIHTGAAGAFGGILVALTPPDATGISGGCVSAPRATVNAILKTPSNYYANVHTSDFPNGAIRGQLAK